jgi:uncharacterized membrane protein YhaH (DUF805 family)
LRESRERERERAGGQGESVYWFGEALRKYADFGGRARRLEYWVFVAFVYVGYVVLGGFGASGKSPALAAVAFVLSVMLLLPGLAVLSTEVGDSDHGLGILNE